MLRFAASTLLVTLAGLTQVVFGNEVVWDRAEILLSSDEAITDQVSKSLHGLLSFKLNLTFLIMPRIYYDYRI